MPKKNCIIIADKLKFTFLFGWIVQTQFQIKNTSEGTSINVDPSLTHVSVRNWNNSWEWKAQVVRSQRCLSFISRSNALCLINVSTHSLVLRSLEISASSEEFTCSAMETPHISYIIIKIILKIMLFHILVML